MELKPFQGEGLLPRPGDLSPNPTADEVRAALAADSARAHLAFLQAVPCLDGDDVVRGTGMPTGAWSPAYAALASWKRQRQLLSVQHNGQELYPAFQFRTDGRPHPSIARILAVLPAHRTPWQVAFWFVSPNGWLDGDAPAERLDDTPEVLAAARHEAEDIEG